jgi:hypothetical protein
VQIIGLIVLKRHTYQLQGRGDGREMGLFYTSGAVGLRATHGKKHPARWKLSFLRDFKMKIKVGSKSMIEEDQ